MLTTLSYTEARAKLASVLDMVTDTREPAVISRRGREDVAVIAASELTGLVETAHLMRSPRNAGRLLAALALSRQNAGKPESLEELRISVGLSGAAAPKPAKKSTSKRPRGRTR